MYKAFPKKVQFSHQDSDGSLLELPGYPVDDYAVTSNGQLGLTGDVRALGKPRKKNFLSYTDLSALLISLICLALGVLTIMPQFSIAWHLGFTGQIIVIGFLLSIMNLCTHAVLPHVFILLEARYGQSRLQNFEAILAGSAFSKHMSFYWRIITLVLIALPVGLSVAYKRFLGGSSATTLSNSKLNSTYSISFPRVNSFSPGNDDVYFGLSAMTPFRSVTQQGKAPYDNDFPTAYGYNVLVLDDYSAAILDLPTNPYIAEMRAMMSANETWIVSASVDAYVASYNTSTSAVTQDDTFWLETTEYVGLSALYLWKGDGTSIGFMPYYYQAYFGLFDNSHWSSAFQTYANSDTDQEQAYEDFRSSAQLYDLSRGRCRGTWEVNATGILLVSGTCGNRTKGNSSVLTGDNMTPYAESALIPLANVYENFVRQSASKWLNVTNAVTVATMYWARALYMINRQSSQKSKYSGPYYPTDETIVSYRATLRADIWLYVVLLIQPAITFLGFLASVWLHKVPITKGFGITSILSGFDASTAGLVKGAGLSGKLTAPVRLEILPTPLRSNPENPFASSFDEDVSIIEYRLVQASRLGGGLHLQPQRTYA